ncbi:TetR family transcriptional regulator [Mycobacterium antarcticum]|uniref:TetR/AcrR family transcriptional regulator n=1 Tax=unclassified Mycolicibacterium TaxID=2636767 RepID=UPI0023A1D62B|nr:MULTISPECIES: TetR/AcrR family transcriptional regulator [unclassified Mycolicibacterium]BDX35167.1 TetR family transcriptional regulator [Mycolicibacterium sp. TUM20985]GLP81429.1 TetR family transcriptional regulator [Mycolicibacterium sp. TUM20984]
MAERADAARNRQAVLSAAGRLFDDAADVDAVSMDDVARAAGVGKGTLFRRFGDRASLLRAVYDARLVDLRTAIESGPPPLGPDGDSRTRISAVLEAIVDFKLDNRRLALAIEQDQTGGAPTLYTSPGYVTTHQLLVQLVTEVGDHGNARWFAYVLLAATRIDLVDHLVSTEDVSRRRLHADLEALVACLLD